MDRPVVCLLLVTLASLSLVGKSTAMSKEQLNKTGQVMKNVCMPKNQVTEEMVGSINQGKFIEDRNVMCYVACVYKMIGVMKNGKIDYETSLKTIDLMFPQDMKEPTRRATEKCKDVSKKYKDICEAAFWTSRCMYDADPVYFFFP